jgi:hypothetical protein
MVEGYIYYSAISLSVLGIVSLIMAVLFRKRSKGLDSLPKNLEATVTSKTFVVFDPYPAPKKVWHRFLALLPFACLIIATLLVIAAWTLLTNGLMLSTFIIIVGVNVVVLEDAPELYVTAKLFIRAIQNNSKLAKGDLRVLRIIQRMVPKLRNYYIGLASFFIGAALILPSAWETLPGFATWLGSSIEQVSGINGTQFVQTAFILLLLGIAVLQFVVFKVKNKVFKYEI